MTVATSPLTCCTLTLLSACSCCIAMRFNAVLSSTCAQHKPKNIYVCVDAHDVRPRYHTSAIRAPLSTLYMCTGSRQTAQQPYCQDRSSKRNGLFSFCGHRGCART